ncbi:MAG TPA: hypothetical protein VM287_06485 [Egibacteraceae bacterium]|nr:hypothetical protein [Egibacteraceae bacterium]
MSGWRSRGAKWAIGVGAVVVLAAGLYTLSGAYFARAVVEAFTAEHRADCDALVTGHGQGSEVEALDDVGPVAVPDFDGVASLRAVVVRADPDQPSMRPIDPLSPESTWFLPERHYDRVVFVGTVEPGVDELADRLERLGQGEIEGGPLLRVNGRTVQRAVGFEHAGNSFYVTLYDCRDQGRWLVSSHRIDPALTGECAAAGRQEACRLLLDVVDEIPSPILGEQRAGIQPRVEPDGTVTITLRYTMDGPGPDVQATHLHRAMEQRGWRRVNPPPCDHPVDMGPAFDALCHVPRDAGVLREPGGLAYARDEPPPGWTATWRLDNDPAAPLHFELRQPSG